MKTPQVLTPEAGDTLTPGDKIPSQKPAFVSRAPAVTATVTESPEGGAEPDRPVEEPWSHMPARAAAAVRQHRAFPSFMRRYIEMAGASGPEMAQLPRPPEAHFVPRILREAGAVTPRVTQLQSPPVASVTSAVTAVPIAGSICPTCQCRVPARLSDADRQRAYRARQREKKEQHLPVAATVGRI